MEIFTNDIPFKVRAKKYFWNNLIAIDQLANTICFGDPDETISSRLGKSIERGNPGPFTKFLVALLDKIEYNHCKKSIEPNEGSDAVN